VLFILKICVVKYAYLIWYFERKYVYMSRIQRHIKSQSNTISEVLNAILQKPTNAASITEETMETNEEKESVRQTSEIVYA
jgi:putative heme iron utilization protein